MNALIAQMIDFVGILPAEWQLKWHDIQVASNFVPVESMSLLKAWFADLEVGYSDWRKQNPLVEEDDDEIPSNANICADENRLSKLEQRFDKKVPEECLKLFLPVIQGLMKFMPSGRLSASQALGLQRQNG